MMKKQSRTILECAIFRHESLEVSKRKSRVWPTFLTSSEVLNTVCHLTQYYQFEGYYNRVHLRLKMMGEGCDAKKCSFAVSILVLLLLPRCKFHQLQQQRQLATILESCKFPRTIAELLSSLILLYSSLLLYAMHFYRNLAYMPKSQRISDNQCTLSTLPLFSRKFKNTNEVICSNKNLRNRRRSLAAWQLTAAEQSEIGKATFIMHAYNLFTQLCNWMSVPFMVSSEFPMKPLL